MHLKTLIFIGFSVSLITYGQEIDKSEYVKDSLLHRFTREIEEIIQSKNDSTSILKIVKKKCDAAMFHFESFRDTNSKLQLYHFSKDFYHLNYISELIDRETQKIVHTDFKRHQYFVEVHALNAKEFLIIERQDDLSFSCYSATVFKLKKETAKKKKGFRQGSELIVCSWTSIATSYPTDENKELLPKSGLTFYEPSKITYETDTKTISYPYKNSTTGALEEQKATYKNGKFKIDDYDVRGFLD